MKNCQQTRKEKGVSPVIASVLMIAVAVSITIIVYAWSSGFMSSRSTQESAQTEKIIVENINLSGTNLTVYLRNKMEFNVYLDAVYVNGQLRVKSIYTRVSAKTVTPVDLTSVVSSHGGNGTFHSGDRVNLVTLRGTQLRFQIA
jgi:flagellin-like protein